ncbi:MAG: DUF4406 domain-containing protein [Succiniclasticum sp.]|uniref:DUF4406 domain-containing protein n=1 Tax=Succiniclasticum sp. TaxID=2775030 RepID=UPI002A91B7F1|nr:DUF4406 domain-containing protein [Succiniclasticum sp.]MDY6291710.1 DUF4406 domain-containing protein [Succiniclasticum sp.]
MIHVVNTAEDYFAVLSPGPVCYISGPITGVEDYWERFADAENMLAENSLIPINPAGAFPEGLPYEWYMKIDLRIVDECDALCFLDGYEISDGAAREAKRAVRNRKEYWAFTLEQLKLAEMLRSLPDTFEDSPEGEKQEKDVSAQKEKIKNQIALKGADLEVWITKVNPPKTELQKQNDKVKKVLRSYLYCQRQIDAACDEITKLDSRRKRITIQYREVHGGGGSDYTEAVIDNITGLEESIVAMMKQLQSERAKVQFWIDSLEDYRERNVLTMCYINGMKFEDIAEKLNYNHDHVRRLHGRGISKLREVFADEIAKM